MEPGHAAQPGAAGQGRTGEQNGERALLGQHVTDGADPVAGNDLDLRVDAFRRFADGVRQFSGALEDEDLGLHRSP
jgi:hypothetical protein